MISPHSFHSMHQDGDLYLQSVCLTCTRMHKDTHMQIRLLMIYILTWPAAFSLYNLPQTVLLFMNMDQIRLPHIKNPRNSNILLYTLH